MSKNTYFYRVNIDLIAGNGGNGCVSFRRERKVPKGGPDGGNGGRGGSIFIQGLGGVLTLADFRYKRIWRGSNGHDGSGQNQSGKSGDDLVITVPMGTEVWDKEAEHMLVDVISPDKQHLLVRAGKGGLGNQNFATSSLQAPAISTKGHKGEIKTILLLLKYMADVGIIGMPNAGKSTFVHKISRANVKIGDYPFSTINPVLGVIKGKDTIVADLPGLMEGSHLDVGLGHEFLQHLGRCKLLVHMIDSSDDDAINHFRIIQNEIKEYDPDLLNKCCIICLSKKDLSTAEQINGLRDHFIALNYEVIMISENDPMDEAVEKICQLVAQVNDEDNNPTNNPSDDSNKSDDEPDNGAEDTAEPCTL